MYREPMQPFRDYNRRPQADILGVLGQGQRYPYGDAEWVWYRPVKDANGTGYKMGSYKV